MAILQARTWKADKISSNTDSYRRGVGSNIRICTNLVRFPESRLLRALLQGNPLSSPRYRTRLPGVP